jgi:hypothetical protein
MEETAECAARVVYGLLIVEMGMRIQRTAKRVTKVPIMAKVTAIAQ